MRLRGICDGRTPTRAVAAPEFFIFNFAFLIEHIRALSQENGEGKGSYYLKRWQVIRRIGGRDEGSGAMENKWLTFAADGTTSGKILLNPPGPV